VNDHIYYIIDSKQSEVFVAALPQIQTSPKNNDAATYMDNNTGRVRLKRMTKKKRIDFTAKRLDWPADKRRGIWCCCVMKGKLYVAIPGRLFVTRLPLNPLESRRIPPLRELNLTGDELHVYGSWMKMAGLATSNQLVLYGGCLGEDPIEYPVATFLVSVTDRE
jgi:hypothetical protein